MLRRIFLAQLTSLDWWTIQVEQMRRDQRHAELEARDRAATEHRETVEAVRAMIRGLNADAAAICNPHLRDVKARKRMHEVAKRLAAATKD